MWSFIKNSLIINILLLMVVLVLGYSAVNMILQSVALSREDRDSQKKLETLAEKKRELEKRLSALESPDAVEREAKERLNLKKPGEEVVVIVPEKKETTQPKEQENFLKFLFNSIKRKLSL